MNERIKDLLEEAGFVSYGEDTGFYTIPAPAFLSRIDRLAELIVRECADACYKHKDVESFGIYPVRVAMVTKACSDNIKEHFGVEE